MKEIESTDIHNGNDNLGKLQVFLFNVGQGDHILLRFPSGEYGIIDFHYATSPNVVEPPCLTYFKSLKRNLTEAEFNRITIAFFCISHTDKDHVKGVVETLGWFDKNGIFVRDIWLGAAHDEAQLAGFLQRRIPDILKEAGLKEKLKLNKSADLFNSDIADFFAYFKKWKTRKFKSPRYSNEVVGTGEYLAEIRELDIAIGDCRAVNVGPFQSQLDAYFNQSNLDLVRKMLGVLSDDTADKNLISHILRIQFGKTNLLFGGDTHRDIWEECLKKYNSVPTLYPRIHGTLDSHFIKVSHHGSKYSSSTSIWKQCIPNNKRVYLGISAGQNRSYSHPHEETIADIREVREDADILVTNFCAKCILQSNLEKEYHLWYDKYVLGDLQYQKTVQSQHDARINEVTRHISNKQHALQQPGLFAYIFSVSPDPNQEITVRLALSRVNDASASCFYEGRPDKMFDRCKPPLPGGDTGC